MNKRFYDSGSLLKKGQGGFIQAIEAMNSGIIPFLQIIDFLELNQHEILQKMGINNVAEFSIAQLNGFSVEQIMKFCEAVKIHPADMISQRTKIIDGNLVRALLYVSRSNRYDSDDSQKATYAIGDVMSILDSEVSKLTYKTLARSIISNIRHVLYEDVTEQKGVYSTEMLPYSFKDWHLAINKENKRLKDRFNKLGSRMWSMANHLFDGNPNMKEIVERLYGKAFLSEHNKLDSLDEDKYIDENVSAEAKYTEYYDDESDKIYSSYSQIRKDFIKTLYDCIRTGIRKNITEKMCKDLKGVPSLFESTDIESENLVIMLDNYYTAIIAYYADDEQLYEWIKSIDIELDLAQTPQNISNMANLVGWAPPKI